VLTRQHENQRIFLKEKRTFAPNSFLSQAARRYVYEHTLYSLCSLDQTTYYLLVAWNTRRSYQKQIRAHMLFAFFIIELKSRRMMHVGAARSPTDAWTAQQLREATPYGQVPTYLICDHDSKFGSCLARVAATSNIELLRTPYHAPRANAPCERFLESVRRECLDHLFILNERQLHRALTAYVAYFNRARPHQGIRQQLPEPSTSAVPLHHKGDKVCSIPILGGLHHDYQRIA